MSGRPCDGPKFLRRRGAPSGLLPRDTPTGSRRLPWQFTILLVQAAVCKALRSDGPVHVDAMRRERHHDEACPPRIKRVTIRIQSYTYMCTHACAHTQTNEK